MDEMTDELLARIAERVRDPKRRYMTAAEDEARIELPVVEIERREEEWTRRLLARSNAAAGGSPYSSLFTPPAGYWGAGEVTYTPSSTNTGGTDGSGGVVRH